MKSALTLVAVAFLVLSAGCAQPVDPDPPSKVIDPLPSWNDGAAKQSIFDFVVRVTDTASPDFVPESQRIAAIDNDGTLWSEQPAYFQLFFAIDRVKALAPEHPEWASTQRFQAVL